MFPQLTTKGLLRLTAVLVLLAIGALGAHTAFAGIKLNTIDPTATVRDDGRLVEVTGPLACTANERVELQVTLTQRTTGAVAQGRTHIRCLGDVQHWQVQVVTEGEARFEEGAAVAVALARTSRQGVWTDAHQWLVAISLANE